MLGGSLISRLTAVAKAPAGLRTFRTTTTALLAPNQSLLAVSACLADNAKVQATASSAATRHRPAKSAALQIKLSGVPQPTLAHVSAAPAVSFDLPQSWMKGKDEAAIVRAWLPRDVRFEEWVTSDECV